MNHKVTNAYRIFVYFSYLPLALLPFALVLGNKLALNMILNVPNRDFSIILPFSASSEHYLAVVMLGISLGGVAIKAFLDNSASIHIWKKAAYGLTSLALLLANAIYMLEGISLAEILIFIILPITMSLHLMSLRRTRLVEMFDPYNTITEVDETLSKNDYVLPEPVKISIESTNCSATFRVTEPAFLKYESLNKNSALILVSYIVIGVCYLPLACLALLSLPLLLDTLTAFINLPLIENVSTWNELPAISLMYLFAIVGLTGLVKMLRIHIARKPITMPDRFSITLMYLSGLANLLIMLKLGLSSDTHSLIVLTVLALPILVTLYFGIWCSKSIWKRNTISISEYFEMELGESLRTD